MKILWNTFAVLAVLAILPDCAAARVGRSDTMKILWIILAVLAVIVVSAVVFFLTAGPKKKDYVHLTEPRFTEKEDVTILKVAFEGDPQKVVQAAFADLFKAYYKTKGVPKGPSQPPSLGRYDFPADVHNMPQEEMMSIPWKGFAAVPVPEGTTLPAGAPATVSVETMGYGTVAELIHFGPYDEEKPNIEKLLRFIEEQGYVVTGLHEEEYIIGPGVPFRKPKDYITFIRYQVEKK